MKQSRVIVEFRSDRDEDEVQDNLKHNQHTKRNHCKHNNQGCGGERE